MPTHERQTTTITARGMGILQRRPQVAALVGFVVLAIVFYGGLVLGRRSFVEGDFNQHFLPFSLFLRSELLAGRLPLWNPYTFAGHPFLADIQAAVFYPLSNLLLLATSPWSSPATRLYWLQVDAILHTALAGFFTYLLAQALTRRHVPALLAGCVFAFSGYLTGYPPLQLAILRTAIWLPLLLWFLLAAVTRPQRWLTWIGASVVYATALFAGHPQTFLHLSYATAGWLAVLLLAYRRRLASQWHALLVRIALFYLIALGLSAVQWLPSLEFTRLSVRASASYDFLSGGFLRHDTWQMLLPRLQTVFSPLFVGQVALGLAVLAVVWAITVRPGVVGAGPRTRPSGPRTRPDSEDEVRLGRLAVLYFSLLAGLALLVSYGRYGFLFPLIYRWLPGWNLFQGQERLAYLVAFGLSMLAGFGAARMETPAPLRRMAALAYAMFAGLAIVLFLMVGSGLVRVEISSRQAWATALVGLLTLAAYVVIQWPDRWARWRPALLLMLAVGELFWFNAGVNVDRQTPAAKTALPPAAIALQTATSSASTANQGLPGRVQNGFQVFDDYGMMTGVEDVWGSSPLHLARLTDLFGDFPLVRMRRLLGVKYVLDPGRDLYQPSEIIAEVPGPAGTLYLHRLQDPNPRAWVVTRIQLMDDAAARPWLADSRLDVEATALLPRWGGNKGSFRDWQHDALLAFPGQNQITLARNADNQLRIDVQSERGGLLVVSENWMPGWQATQVDPDGRPLRRLPVLRADLTLLGIPVQAGASHIDLVYQPASVRWGLLIGGLTLLQLGAALIWRRRRGRGGSPYPPGTLAIRGETAARLLALAAVFIALALRLWGLDFQELRGDEAWGFLFSLAPWTEIVRTTLVLREPHPVASYLLQHVWLLVAGHGEFAFRFISAWFGALAVALIYRLGRQLRLGWPASILAAMLLALSPYAIWHSQDARMYSISLALTLASTVLALHALHQPRWRNWLAYVVITWLALHNHYFSIFILVAQNLFVLVTAVFDRSLRRLVGPWLLAQMAVGLLYLPWLIAARDTLATYHGNGDSPGFGAMWVRALSVFAVGETVPAEQRLWVALLAGFLLALGAVRLLRAGGKLRQALFLLALYLAVPLLATWLSALSRPIFNERYLVAAVPAFYLLVAAAVAGPASQPLPGAHQKNMSHLAPVLQWVAVASLVVLVASTGMSLRRYYTDPNDSKTAGWRALAATLTQFSTGLPADRVRLAQSVPDPTLWYYYQGDVEHLVLPPAAHDEIRARAEVARLVEQGVERVVLAVQPADYWDERGIAQAALASQYELLTEVQVGNWPVQVYSRSQSEPKPLDVSFANGLTLAAGAPQARSLVPGDTVLVQLRWEGSPAALSGSEKISLQLLDGAGRLVAQTDQPIGAEQIGVTTSYPLPLPLLLQPDDYRLILAVYDPGREGAPRLLTTTGDDHVELGVLHSP